MTDPENSSDSPRTGNTRNESASPRISVIVPTHNRPDYVIDAVRSIANQALPDPGSFEILVIENAPQATLEARIAELTAEFSVAVGYLHETRPGLHQARHRGALEAHGLILVYVDDDVLAPPGWLAAMVEPFDNKDVAIVGGLVRPRWEAPTPVWLDQFPASYLSLLDAGGDARDFDYPDGAYGCNMAVRRGVLIQVGGFHPDAMGWDRRRFWLRGDGEGGLHLRVLAAGHRAVYQPSAIIDHRIPGARLTLSAMCRRALLVGLSHSFMDIRSDLGDSRKSWRRTTRGLKSLALMGRHAASILRHRTDWRFRLSEVWRRYGYARQHLLAVFNGRAREYLERESYLDDEVCSDAGATRDES